MSRWQANLGWGLVLAMLAGGFWLAISPGEAQVAAPQKTPAPETLLPADAVLYIGTEGMAAHRAEFEKTAAYQALYETGLVDALVKLATTVQEQSGQGAEEFKLLKSIYETLMDNGASVAVSVSADQGPPMPYSVVVFHQGAKFTARLSKFVTQATRNDVAFQTNTVNGRKVTSGVLPNSPGVELGWWNEGQHLVITAGMNAVENATAVAAGTSPNIKTHPLWKKYHDSNPPQGMTTLSWLDLGSLGKMFGQMPLPPAGPDAPQSTINDVLAAVGMNNVGALVSRSGFRGEAMWSDTLLETTGPRKGLLAYATDKTLTLKDLPPLPAKNLGFHVCTVDWPKVYANTVELAQNLAKLGPPDNAAQLEGVLQNVPAIIGFDPQTELFNTLGDVSCVYADSELSLFGLGFAIAQKIQDEKTFKETVLSLLDRIAQQTRPREFTVKKAEKQGREIVILEIGGGVFNPSFSVDDGWLVVGLVPQTVESFFLRLDGKLDHWEPSAKHEKAFAELPKKFTALTVTDPEAGVRLMMGIAPLLMPALQAAWQESGPGRRRGPLPFSVAELPPAELVAKPLFPNVAMQTVDENGILHTSRMSLPTVPLMDSGGGAPAVAIGVALLLPAVQSAREAARRSQSKNNLKQLGLAMHNYHDTFREFPPGTHPNEKLKTEERLSWIAKILPFLEQSPLYDRIDFDEEWDSNTNSEFTSTVIPTLMNPGMPSTTDKDVAAATQYVGIAGVGKDAPTLPANHPRAGIFGYNRGTRIANITDGTSNTAMISEAGSDIGNWAQGGKSTIRALTTKPYINGPDGIGAKWSSPGVQMCFGDGAVRFISENVDPSVMEAIATMSGGEVVGDF